MHLLKDLSSCHNSATMSHTV